MSGLSEQDREALATAVCRRDDYGNFVPRHLHAAVEQIVARHVAAALTEAADAIEAEGAALRAAYREHNAERDLASKPPRRPDLDAWANAAEVYARLVRNRSAEVPR